MPVPALDRRAMPTLASGSFVQSASTTVSKASKTSSASKVSYSAVVTPPSADGNPNIWKSNNIPEGTVYIAVGSCVGAIFAILLMWYIITRYLSRRAAKESTYGHATQSHLSRWGDSDGGIYEHGDEKELYQSLVDHNEGDDIKPKKSLIGLLGGNSNGLHSSGSFDTLPGGEVDDDLLGGYHERFNPVQDFVPSHFPRSSLFISPTLEVVQQQQQSRSMQGRSNHFHNLSVSSLPSTAESSNNLDRPERTASPERKPKGYARYHQRNKSSVGISEHSKSASESEPNKQAPSKFLNNLLEGEDSL
ncbi:PRM5 (YIL117C) and YNL058C [Zygosaccharomyces parabailii]|nr:PRM5 (YIL117C) and YNL058C [Zygosaccharomyces parabailii]SJM88002.1 related to Vacuolar membrane protein ZYRO0A01628g [Zygosaccharomyces bailii]